MKLYAFPSSRSLAVVALKNHLALDCEVQPIDLGRGDQLTPEYLAPNPNKKMPALEDDGFMLWESNAILFYFAGKRPDHGLWPSDLQGQADVLRWRRMGKRALGRGVVRHGRLREGLESCPRSRPSRPCFHCARRTEFQPFRGRAQQFAQRQDLAPWRTAHDRRFFSRGLVPSAERMQLPVGNVPDIVRWYKGLAALPAWQEAAAARDAAMAAWQLKRAS